MKPSLSQALLAALLPLPFAACASSDWEPGVAVDRADPLPTPEVVDDPTDTEESGEPQTEAPAEPARRGPTKAEEEARIEAIYASPKRASSDLIGVAFYPVQGEELILDSGETFTYAYLDSFYGHEVLRPLDEERVADAWNQAAAEGSDTVHVPADIVVSTSVTQEGEVVTLRATVASTYLYTSYDYELSGSPTVELCERFVGEVERVMLELVGPSLPANSDHLRREEHLEAGDRRALDRRRAQEQEEAATN